MTAFNTTKVLQISPVRLKQKKKFHQPAQIMPLQLAD